MDNLGTTLERVIEERTERHIESLEWHDTLDVQNAVKKTYNVAFRAGMEYVKESSDKTLKAVKSKADNVKTARMKKVKKNDKK